MPNRLPTTAIPSHYEIHLQLPSPNDVNSQNFTGIVQIYIQTLQQTSCLVLSASSISFTNQDATFSINSQTFTPSQVSFLSDLQQVVIQFSESLPIGFGWLNISYGAHLGPASAGLFRSPNTFQPSDYPSHLAKRYLHAFRDPKERAQLAEEMKQIHSKRKSRSTDLQMFATQFESFAARTVFPCWDEPSFKATFRAQVTVPNEQGLVVLFNTPEESAVKSSDGQSITFSFAKTKIRMSSYLVAFAVGQFDYVETTQDNIRFRVYTPPGASKYAQFALNASANIVSYFGKKFGLSYYELNPKMDQISVPYLFGNAMENQGLLTYFPAFLLVDPNSDRIPLELVTQVTVHEIAHQWYGDTITCPYWTSEYLQEGFARYLQYSGTDFLFPEWDVFYNYAPNDFFGGDISFYGWPFNSGLQADYQGLSPPVVVLNETGTESGTMLYEKGASVNRMIELYLGYDTFMAALGYHVQQHRFQNPNVYDLMNSFNTVTGLDIQSRWLPWLIQPGFPVILVSLDAANNVVTISQSPISRYLDPNSNWWIPLHVRASTTQGYVEDHFIEVFNNSAEIILPISQDWIIEANFNWTVFALVNYDDSNWHHLIDFKVNANTSDLDIQLLTKSVLIQTQMSQINLDIALYFSNSLGNYLASQAVTSADAALVTSTLLLTTWFKITTAFLPYVDLYEDLSDSIWAFLVPLKDQVQWTTGGPIPVQKLRSLVLFWSVFYGDPDSIQQAQNYFGSLTALPNDLRPAVLWAAALQENTYEQLIQLFPTFNQTDAARDILVALAGGPNELGLCKRFINFLDQESGFDASNKLKGVALSFSYNGLCRPVTWTYFVQLAEDLWKAQGASATPSLISAFDGIFSSDVEKSQVYQFLTANKQYVPDQTIHNVLIKIEQNADLISNQ